MTLTTVELEKVDLRFPRPAGLLSSIKSIFGKKTEGFQLFRILLSISIAGKLLE